jgi:hypothetical protein
MDIMAVKGLATVKALSFGVDTVLEVPGDVLL